MPVKIDARTKRWEDSILQIRVCDEDSYAWPVLCKRRHLETLTVAELIEWNDRLNEHLLMPSANVAKLYIDLHHRMLTEVRDVEGEEDMRVF
jgi:hypothetical protein